MRKIDRRIGKTKTAVHEAMIKLLQDHNISDITIVELCEKADINRKTFYNHYKDIYSVVGEIEDIIVDSLIQYLNVEFQNEKETKEVDINQVLQHFKSLVYPFTKGLIAYIRDHPEFSIIRENCKSHSNLLDKIVAGEKKFLEELLGDQALNSIWLDYYLTYIVDGMNVILTNWENAQYPVDNEQLARFLTALLTGNGISHFVEDIVQES